MGGTFVITLREGFEAALILGIVYTYLQKIGAERHYRYATRGGLLGVLASIALGVVVTALSGPLLDLGPDVIGLGVIFVAVVVLTWHGYWMRQHARAMPGDVQKQIDQAQATHRMWIIGVIAFTGVFREGAETVLFMWGLLTQATSTSGWASALGAVLGLVMAASLGWAIFRAVATSVCSGSSASRPSSCCSWPPACSAPGSAGSRPWGFSPRHRPPGTPGSCSTITASSADF